MKKLLLRVSVLVHAVLLYSSCNKDATPNSHTPYFPLQIGNYWQSNEKNYIKVIGKKKIAGNEFYVLAARIGGDSRDTMYYRIDDKLNLIQAHFRKQTPTVIFLTKAKFNAQIGDMFYTTSMDDPANELVEVVEKSEDKIKFKYSRSNSEHTTSYFVEYKRGLGVVDNFKQIRVNGSLYTF
ncbi:hypothetical protein Q0590_35335 [Rhodocytophaga aerolata]|uniref:Lipoprotein n=1 Tax=Rhodocytophaga aerolata TaxID=455078 RepID=A0ABT8RKI9_9BACT|nr:hypothetical protein [Rhodocytophaga aerolata]MDO1451600.1 hypothetical protein [Rhodocytophaga aerolata]